MRGGAAARAALSGPEWGKAAAGACGAPLGAMRPLPLPLPPAGRAAA